MVIKHINSDITCIIETHFKTDIDNAGNQRTTIAMDNYIWIGVSRPRINVRALKASGGVGILIKNSFLTEYNVKVIDKSFDGILGVEFRHKYTDFVFIVSPARKFSMG